MNVNFSLDIVTNTTGFCRLGPFPAGTILRSLVVHATPQGAASGVCVIGAALSADGVCATEGAFAELQQIVMGRGATGLLGCDLRVLDDVDVSVPLDVIIDDRPYVVCRIAEHANGGDVGVMFGLLVDLTQIAKPVFNDLVSLATQKAVPALGSVPVEVIPQMRVERTNLMGTNKPGLVKSVDNPPHFPVY